MKKLIILTLAIAMLTGCAPWNQEMYGYDRAELVRGEAKFLYMSVAGKLDEVFYLDPDVQAHAYLLAKKAGYAAYFNHQDQRAYVLGSGTYIIAGSNLVLDPGDHELLPVSCSRDGLYLYFL